MPHVRLTEKQQKFCEIYVETGNASEAYRQAYSANGMSPSAINVNAAKLLKNTKVALRVRELESVKAQATQKAAERLEITMSRVLEELARIAFANVRDFVRIDDDGLAYVDLTDVPREKFAGVMEINTSELKAGRDKNAPIILKTRLKLANKIAALTELRAALEEAEKKGKDTQPEDERPRAPDENHLAKLQKLFGSYGSTARH